MDAFIAKVRANPYLMNAISVYVGIYAEHNGYIVRVLKALFV